MAIRLVIAYLLNLFDLMMTNHWIDKYGIEIEANPIGRWLYQNNIATPIKIFGIGALFLTIYYAVRHRDSGLKKSFQWWDVVSWIILVVYSALTIYHIILTIRVYSIVF